MKKDVLAGALAGIIATAIGTPIGDALSSGWVIKNLGGFTNKQVEKKVEKVVEEVSDLSLIQTGARRFSPAICVDNAKKALAKTGHFEVWQQDGNYVLGKYRNKDGLIGHSGVDCHSTSVEWVNVFIATSGKKADELARVRAIQAYFVANSDVAELTLKQ